MRALIQRVTRSSVKVDGKEVGKSDKGMLVFLGVAHEDQVEDLEWLAKKICQMRIFNDAEDKMNLSVLDVDGDILLISQFTLLASTKKGNRPSYKQAASPDFAQEYYLLMAKELEKYLGKPVGMGKFGQHMEVDLVNDGPVTIWLDSRNRM